MQARGDIYSPFAGRAKEYAWNACLRLAPRNITPTDIDYAVECNGRFLFFEMKTEGVGMSYGQKTFYERLLVGLGDTALLCIVEHGPLDRIEMPDDVERCAVWQSRAGFVQKSGWLDGGSAAFIGIYEAFFQWADGRWWLIDDIINYYCRSVIER